MTQLLARMAQLDNVCAGTGANAPSVGIIQECPQCHVAQVTDTNGAATWFVPHQAHIEKEAHDSGDGATIYHCPFCGGGQVLSRSDGTTICDFCSTAFTVQVQPEHPSMPQTVNGKPVNVPGMPGQIDEPQLLPDPADPAAVDPSADPVPPQKEDADTPAKKPAKDSLPPNFSVKERFYLTRDAVALPEDSYLRHLALAYADNREGVLAQVRAENEMKNAG